MKPIFKQKMLLPSISALVKIERISAGTQRGRSEEPKDAQGRRPSANILNMHKTVAETLHSC